MKFSTENLRTVFAEEGKYENFRNLCFNLVHGNDIYELDDEGNERKVSKADANKAIRKVFMEICGLSEEDMKSKKRRQRAERIHKEELFEVIEEDIDFRVMNGFEDSEWFNQFVEMHNIALGDGIEFVADQDEYFVVCDYSGDNHDITMQQLGEGRPISVTPTPKTIKIGKDIDLIVLGRVDYTKWIDKVAAAFVQYVKQMAVDALYGAVNQIPAGAGLTGTGTLAAATKPQFDAIIEKVGALNGTDVMIVGTKNALKKITALADVNWAAESQKESVADTGRLGRYEGTLLFEVPQRYNLTDINTPLVDDGVLLILPMADDKFVKMVDEGETEIFEVTEKAELVDDFNTYEMSRRIGVAAALGRYFGEWEF